MAQAKKSERMGWVIGIKPERLAEYRSLHKNAWPEVLKKISDCNITNYAIYLREPENLLFACWDYVGEDFDVDMARMNEHEETRKWWALTDPCQVPLDSRRPGEQWARMEEVFYLS